MSGNADAQAIIASAYVAMYDNYCGVAAQALSYYDYLITFHNEVTLFWIPMRINGASVLFLLNRYFNLVMQIGYWTQVPKSLQVALHQFEFFYVIDSLQYLPCTAFSALRTYALCPKPYKSFISAIVFSLALVPLVVNMLHDLRWTSYVYDPTVPGNVAVDTLAPNINMRFVMACRFSLVAADLLVLCVTWYQTFETVKMSRRFAPGQDTQSLASTLLHDGTSYFLILLILNVLHIAFTLSSIANDPFSPSSVVLLIEEPLTSVLTSRFLINLQLAKRRQEGSFQSISEGTELAFEPQTSSSHIDRFIKSMGGQLSFDHDSVEEDNTI
ncbi:hypothetical protein DICSQDRAFT_141176 [Dichomitus squalens LYAD-421 SS1]|uniref:DUF6533 domain-containing protein n=1 Tax=Dichomitus squalens (strain LYAD-421) TaxID=732165 RepID=R7SK87_DICSQ|nr:uncharacterized protein DICSQDRAFT_141176 [Dichomitus squalens LYAD-421 SS1]EJF56554.1 hypothetical protein DICSQDRAFT_141176 [Dichomitus squalens LYAD-421 SS1]